jgi:hypothetical protein
MSDKMLRREFTTRSILALLGGVVITITGCNDSRSPTSPGPEMPPPSVPPTSNPPPALGDVSGVISANHGHVATVTGAELTAGNAVVLDIMGSADHSHRVELSAAEIGQIASGGTVVKSSSIDLSHNHTVTFN